MRLWARLTGGLSGSQEAGDPDQGDLNLEDQDQDQGEEWEDLDEESLGDSDSSVELIDEDEESRKRAERIKKGQIARAIAREREQKLRVSTCPSMPGGLGSLLPRRHQP